MTARPLRRPAPPRVLRRVRAARPAYSVGRSFPAAEIADLGAAIDQLDADLQGYSPPPGDVTALRNWTELQHRVNGFELAWGQFQRDMASDWYWGDDDEARLAGLKTSYNSLRRDVLEYTAVRVTAPDVDVSPPGVEPPPPGESPVDRAVSGLVGALKVVVVVVGVGAAALAARRLGLLSWRVRP